MWLLVSVASELWEARRAMAPTLSKNLILPPTLFDTKLHVRTIKCTAIIVLQRETIELTIIMQKCDMRNLTSAITYSVGVKMETKTNGNAHFI